MPPCSQSDKFFWLNILGLDGIMLLQLQPRKIRADQELQESDDSVLIKIE